MPAARVCFILPDICMVYNCVHILWFYPHSLGRVTHLFQVMGPAFPRVDEEENGFYLPINTSDIIRQNVIFETHCFWLFVTLYLIASRRVLFILNKKQIKGL